MVSVVNSSINQIVEQKKIVTKKSKRSNIQNRNDFLNYSRESRSRSRGLSSKNCHSPGKDHYNLYRSQEVEESKEI